MKFTAPLYPIIHNCADIFFYFIEINVIKSSLIKNLDESGLLAYNVIIFYFL